MANWGGLWGIIGPEVINAAEGTTRAGGVGRTQHGFPWRVSGKAGPGELSLISSTLPHP